MQQLQKNTPFGLKEKLEQAKVEEEATILRKEEGDYEIVLSYEENAKAAAFEASAGEKSLSARRSITASTTWGVGGAIDVAMLSVHSLCVCQAQRPSSLVCDLLCCASCVCHAMLIN